MIIADSPITLRFLLFARKDHVDLLCSDTDIAVTAKSLEEAKHEMHDALSSYLLTFSETEREHQDYIRRTPFGYRFLWKLGFILSSGLDVIAHVRSLLASFDPMDRSVRFAR